MHGVSKSTIHIPSIDLTEDGEVKQELTLENECTSTTCKYTFRILIENEVCSYVIKINKRFFFPSDFVEMYEIKIYWLNNSSSEINYIEC